VAALKRCAQAWFPLRCHVHIEFNKQEFASYGSASQSGKLTALAHFAADGPGVPLSSGAALVFGKAAFWHVDPNAALLPSGRALTPVLVAGLPNAWRRRSAYSL
jgi:hypothetical protein